MVKKNYLLLNALLVCKFNRVLEAVAVGRFKVKHGPAFLWMMMRLKFRTKSGYLFEVLS